MSRSFAPPLKTRCAEVSIFPEHDRSAPCTAGFKRKLLTEETGNYTFLSIRNPTHLETVRARAEGGYILLDRGLEGTEAVKHPYGACVTTISPTIVAVIKDLFCNYSCCQGAVCDCTAVTIAAADLPDANVGVPWEGTVTLSGTLPIDAAVTGAPLWMRVVQERNMLRLSGTPDVAGAVSLLVEAANCNNTAHVSEAVQVVVKE